MADGLCTQNPCSRCRFRYGVIGNHICCGYILVKEQRRPCPAGEGCTVFEKGSSFSEKALNHEVVRKVNKTCVDCGKTFYAGTKAKYCPECNKRKSAQYTINNHKRKQEARAAAELSKDKYCCWCGALFHSDSALKTGCPACKAKTKWQREQIRKERLKNE